MYIACSTITWNAVRRQEGGPYAGTEGYGRILDEVRQAGYSHVVAGVRSAPEGDADPRSQPENLLKFLADRGLQPAPGYYSGQSLYDAANRDGEVEGARRAAVNTRALGLDALFVGPTSNPQRRATAGHYPGGGRPDSPTDEQQAVECETLNQMGRACREEGVWLCLHNHAGMYWETEDEIERVLAGTDPDLVAMGPDVGHMVWGGVDPVPWFRRHMGRVRALHLKDMHAEVLRQAREEKLSYGETSDRGVFAEIGEGCVDWPALFRIWRDAGYAGSVVVEIDRTTKPAALESATASRRYLREVIGV